MFLGIYRFKGDAGELLSAYEKLLQMMPPENMHLQVCVSDGTGISIYDACPTREIFEAFSSSPDMQAALQGAGLPKPEVSQLGDVHAAFVAGERAI
ncbi:MAG: hypothetical protein R3188_01675 [Acidiferrobacterales bacterium]|nr:hypothetical protein [Acidiferrobacterales bacterium]